METIPKAVVVHAGARDEYQLALALTEGDLLDQLVTEMYWPLDQAWFAQTFGKLLPSKWLSARYHPGLSSKVVALSARAFSAATLMQMMPRLRLHRYKDKALSRQARRLALKHDTALFCYSYYAGEAFRTDSESVRHRFIFQLHPHPVAVRNLLQEELQRVPEARASLMREHELILEGKDFDDLALEPHLANGWVVASSYTAQTLAERGIERSRIHVIPYGIDLGQFTERHSAPAAQQPFTIMFLGSLSQRKGLSYLLGAIRLLKTQHIRVLLRGRGIVDQILLAQYVDVPYDLQLNLPTSEIVRDLHSADVFVLPSLAEGFGHVILQAMGCGVPAITTPHTCGADIINEGQNGFIVPIRSVEALAEKIQWGIDHRIEMAALGTAAAARARQFTWERFRSGIRAAYQDMVSATE